MNEIWKDVVGYEGRYKVSNCGNVKSVVFSRKGKEKELSLLEGKDYLLVKLYKNGIGTMCRVHRLVAEAFIENPDNCPVVNHKNWDKRDNRVENLEWCTYSYNNSYKKQFLEKKKTKAKEKSVHDFKDMSPKEVVCVETGDIFSSVSDAGRWAGVNQSNISRVLRGIQRTSGGYHWKYLNEKDKSVGTLSIAEGNVSNWIPLSKSDNPGQWESGVFNLCDIRKMKGNIRFALRESDGEKEICILAI